MSNVTVYLRPVGSPWQVLGREIYSGLYPTTPRVESDAWGYATCSFDLPRDPFLPQPDLSSFTPCVIEDGDTRIFEGKVMETPARGDPERVINVQGRGMQYTLDENPVEYAWVHSDMTQWKDMRSIPGYDATVWTPQGTVNTGDGRITLGKESGVTWAQNQAEGVFLDLGPHRRARRIELLMSSTNLGSATFVGFVRGMTVGATFVSPRSGIAIPHWGESGFEAAFSPYPTDYYSDAILMHGSPTGTQVGFPPLSTVSGYFRIPVRSVAIFLFWSGAGGTTAASHLWTIERARVYTSTAYGRRHLGNLTATDVVETAVRRASVGIVVPEQSAVVNWGAGHGWSNEIRQLEGGVGLGLTGGGAGGAFYRFRSSPGRLAPEYNDNPAGASLVASPTPPTYSDTGGPIIDGDPGGSAYATYSGTPRWHTAPANSFPGTAAGDGHYEAGLAFWFRTTNLGTGFVSSWRDYNNRLCAVETTAANPAAGQMFWGIVITDAGWVQLGVRDSGGGEGTWAVAKPGGASPNYADGEWHLVMFRWNRQAGTIALTVDERDAFLNPSNSATLRNSLNQLPGNAAMTNTALAFATRGGGDKQFAGDLAEIAWWRGEIDLAECKHLYRAARVNLDTTLKRTMLRIDGMSTTEPRTARDVVESVNAYHRWVTKVGRNQTLEFRPRPVFPKYALTAAASRRFSQAALTAGEESYNRVVVYGKDGFGNDVAVERIAAHQTGATFETDLSATSSNPSFDTNTTGWSADGTLTRDTVTFQTSPASGSLAPTPLTNSTSYVFHAFSGTFRRGRLYRLTFYLYPAAAYSSNVLRAYFGNVNENDFTAIAGSWGTVSTWAQYSVDWVPRADLSGELQVYAPDSYRTGDPSPPGVQPKAFKIDTLDLRIAVNGQLDRQNDLRTKTITHNQPLTTQIGISIGDAFLGSRYKQQLRGSVEVGPGDLVLAATGEPVHPRYLVSDTMELLHIPSLVDPDTGAQGRDGLIVGVAYDPETERASVSVDNQADNFETLMNRHALFSGG